MRRGEVYDVNLEPVQGSEQGETRPAIIVSEVGCVRRMRFSRLSSQSHMTHQGINGASEE